MARKSQSVTKRDRVIARLPYTQAALERRAARLGVTVQEITEGKRLPKAAG